MRPPGHFYVDEPWAPDPVNINGRSAPSCGSQERDRTTGAPDVQRALLLPGMHAEGPTPPEPGIGAQPPAPCPPIGYCPGGHLPSASTRQGSGTNNMICESQQVRTSQNTACCNRRRSSYSSGSRTSCKTLLRAQVRSLSSPPYPVVSPTTCPPGSRQHIGS